MRTTAASYAPSMQTNVNRRQASSNARAGPASQRPGSSFAGWPMAIVVPSVRRLTAATQGPSESLKDDLASSEA